VKISLGIVDLILFTLAIQGFVLSALLFSTSKKIYSNRWIAVFIFVIAAGILMQQIDYSGIWEQHLWIVNYIVVPDMALGPAIYLYARSLIHPEEKSNAKTWLNFLPLLIDLKRPVIFIFYVSGFLAIPFVQKFYFLSSTQHFLFAGGAFNGLPAFISVTIYAVITYRMVSRNLNDENLSRFKKTDLAWIKRLLRFVFGLLLLWTITVALRLSPLTGSRTNWQEYIFVIPNAIFAYWLGMTTYLRQRKMSSPDLLEYTTKSSRPYFKETDAPVYRQQLLQLMEVNKLHLNPQLKLEILAEKLDVPEKSISSLLNQFVGKNFNDFVNEYRVEEAKKKLSDPAWNYLSISGIAFECGFNSLSTFQRAFKQFTGLTPGQYQAEAKTTAIFDK
jgi:AraC-like DNA-binding protein